MTWNNPWAPAPERTAGSPHDSSVITTATRSAGRANSSAQRSISGVQRRTASGKAGATDDGEVAAGGAGSASGRKPPEDERCKAAQTMTIARRIPSRVGMATAGWGGAAGGGPTGGEGGGGGARFR